MMDDEIQVVRKYVQGSPPVDVKALIQELGIEYCETELPFGVSGEIEYNGDGFRIFVNANESKQRRRFTAAHELGHFLLHRDMLRRKGSLNRHSDILFGDARVYNPAAPFSPQHEVQANKYAAEILMPRSKVVAKFDKTANNYQELADLFGVSHLAMQIRLNNLGLEGKP